MRYNKSLFDKVKTGNFLGVNRPNGRVTVDPYWSLQKTPSIYGNSFKGPFRYYTDYDASSSTPGVQEFEVPSVKSIQWNRSTSQDLGSCTITIYNMWHNLNSEEQELAGQLGKKGYFWPKRGQGDSAATWNQEAGKGAYRKDGTWDAQFSWENVLVEDVIIRCVDVETEILTKRGWLKYNQVQEGDFALGINPETGLSEWQKIKEVFRKNIDQEIIHLKTRVHDSMTTQNHRWLVKNRNNVFTWKTTETLNADSRIPLAASFNNGNDKIYEDDFVELAAWYYTEGSFDRRSGSYINIRQSETANQEYCDRIYNLLNRLFGEPGPLPRGKRLDSEMVKLAVKMIEEGDATTKISLITGISKETIRRWKTGQRTPNLNPALWDVKRYDDCLTFVISSFVVSELLTCITGSDKVPSLDFINSLTNEQLNLFIDVSVMADGTEDENQKCLIQSNEERIKAFEMICVLAGQSFHTTFRKDSNCAKISLLRNKYTSPISSLNQRGSSPEIVHYNDVIWCPRVEHGNWFARRNGCGYFTGNTYEGYGGHSSNGQYVSIDENLEDGDLLLTGVWIVNTVSAGADGMMTLECTDIGRILIDQIAFPPVIPPGAYPLEYYPPGKSAFDSPWGPKVKGKELVNELGEVVSTSSANRGEVWIRSFTSSASGDSTVSTLYPGSAAVDGDWDTYALSEAYETMDGGRPYWEFLPGSDPNYGAGINSIKLKTWGGGYTVYVSIAEDPNPDNPSSTSVWKGVDTIPDGGIKYIKKVQVPLYLPDGMENPIEIDLADYPEEDDPFTRPTQNTYYAHKVRLTFENLQYSHVPDGTKRYRAGIRDLVFFRDGAEFSEYAPVDGLSPWTFCIEQHPTRGYWVVDSTGRVHGFGDASDYDFNRFGDVPINSYETGNRAVSMAAHPSGEGYWVLDWIGRVWAYGPAADGATTPSGASGRVNFGEYKVPDPYVDWDEPGKVQARGIAATHTGDGYWVVYSNGVIRGFGDATPTYATVPANDVAIFMDWFLAENYATGTYVSYSTCLKATAIASHPKKMGFWVTDGSGQVWGFGVPSYGGLKNRVYRPGLAGRFKLQNQEWATAIEATPTGEGYWIAFGSGKVGSFGDAVKMGKDPYVINQLGVTYPENVIFDDNIEFDNSFFRRIMWGLARDPSGKGFWVLSANGDVTPYDADFWGQPGYTGLTGYKWHDGNFDGDWKNIVADILMWGGFLFYDPDITDEDSPSVYGNLESTGIITDTTVPGDKFDKKTLMDIIKELTEVVGYRFRIDEEGRARYESPNFWRAGNFDRDGVRIYVDNDGNRVDAEDEEAQIFIPTLHESEDLVNYNVTLNSTDKRSEIIIGTDLPNPKDPTTTGYIVHNPPHSLERVAGNTPTMRGIERTAIWVSQLFENEQERKLMAELIGLHAWFSSRLGSCSITANPGLSLDDQVRIIEQNTSETFIHLINAISSSNDLDSGEYTMDLTTSWMGTADNWVIKNEEEPSDYVYTVISDNLNSWQVRTNRGLGAGTGRFDSPTITAYGSFDTITAEVSVIPKMLVLGDSMSYLDSTLNGLTGDRWPNLLEDAGSVTDVYNGAMSGYTTDDLVNDPIIAPGASPATTDLDALVIFIGANDQNESLSGVDADEFYNNIVELLGDYSADKQLVVFPWPWTGYPESEPDPAPTPTEYANFAEKAQEAAEDSGASFLHLGDAIEAVINALGDSDWGDYIVDWIHPSALGHEFIAEQVSSALHVSYGEPTTWSFSGDLQIIGQISNLNIGVDTLSNLGHSIFLEMYNSSDDLVFARTLSSSGQVLNYGSIGNASSQENYTIRVTGVATSKGTGKIKLSFKDGTYNIGTIEDSIIFLEV